MSRKKTHEEHLQDLVSKGITHIPLDRYSTTMTPIRYKCTNNHEWSATPNKILAGRGCPRCAAINTSNRCKKTTKEYKEQLPSGIEVLEEYQGSHTKILHKCILGHEWLVKPTNILHQGTGCPTCANRFSDDLPAILYYLKISGKEDYRIYYKIGITKQLLKKRFQHDLSSKDIKVLMWKHYSKGSEAKAEELRILSEFKDFRKIDMSFIYSGGTELFLEDVLQLDT